MFLHILADTLGSISVIVSAVCIERFDLYTADSICCFVNAFCITLSVLPLMKSTLKLLLLGNDGKLSQQIIWVLKKETFAGEKLELENIHIWELTEDEFVCSIKVGLQRNHDSPSASTNEDDDSVNYSSDRAEMNDESTNLVQITATIKERLLK